MHWSIVFLTLALVSATRAALGVDTSQAIAVTTTQSTWDWSVCVRGMSVRWCARLSSACARSLLTSATLLISVVSRNKVTNLPSFKFGRYDEDDPSICEQFLKRSFTSLQGGYQHDSASSQAVAMAKQSFGCCVDVYCFFCPECEGKNSMPVLSVSFFVFILPAGVLRSLSCSVCSVRPQATLRSHR